MFVDRLLANRFERTVAHRAAEFARTFPGSAVQPCSSGSLIFGAPGMPTNRAIAIGMEGPVSERDLETIQAFYRDREQPARIDLCPLADSSLMEALSRHGFTLELALNLLYIPLHNLPEAPPTEVDIQPVQPETLELWQRTVAQGFSGVDSPPDELLVIIGATAKSATGRTYLAYLDGQPGGGGAMLVYKDAPGGVVELCSASTRPAFRRRGVQTALLYGRLQAARSLGCDLAISMTTPGSASQRNMERLGFRLAYTRLIMKGS